MAVKKRPTKRTAPTGEAAKLRKENAGLKDKLEKVTLERNFLQRAMSDLNFHNNAHDGVVYTDAEDKITYANPYFLTMMGLESKGDVLKKNFPGYMWEKPDDPERLFRDIKKDGFVRERELALYNKEGQPVFAMCSAVASKDDEGNIIGTEIMFCNITGKRQFQAELMEQNALFDVVLQSTPDPILLLDAGLNLRRANEAAREFFQLERDEGIHLADMLYKYLRAEECTRITQLFENEKLLDFDVALGDQHFDWHAAPLKSEQGGWVCVLHNITLRKLTQEMLQHHAFHDALTQVPNRTFFIDHLQRANLRASQDPGYRYAALFIDLDDLKAFNDTFGHLVGDELLNNFARRIESSIRPGDVVARLGGDEFAVFLDRVDQMEDAVHVARRVREAILRPFRLSGHPEDVHTTASIGIALNNPQTDTDTLLRDADRAMYEVKQRGGNDIGLFTPSPVVD